MPGFISSDSDYKKSSSARTHTPEEYPLKFTAT